jgi:hypothetical protein
MTVPTGEEYNEAVRHLGEAKDKLRDARLLITKAQNLLCQDNPAHGLFYDHIGACDSSIMVTKHYLTHLINRVEDWGEETI